MAALILLTLNSAWSRLDFAPSAIFNLSDMIRARDWCDYMYRKSYESECISWFMGTSDVLKVFKIARAVGECNLRTFKTSRVTINHEMHEQVHTIFYLLYTQQNYSNVVLCTSYVLHRMLQWFPKCSRVLFEPIRNIMLWQVNQAWSFWRFLKKLRKYLES